MDTLTDRLAARTLELVDIPSESGTEAVIRKHVLDLVPTGWTPEYAGDEAFFFVSPRRAGYPLVVLAAHYDTVPAQGNIPGRIDDGAVHGLGQQESAATDGRAHAGAEKRAVARRYSPARERRWVRRTASGDESRGRPPGRPWRTGRCRR